MFSRRREINKIKHKSLKLNGSGAFWHLGISQGGCSLKGQKRWAVQYILQPKLIFLSCTSFPPEILAAQCLTQPYSYYSEDHQLHDVGKMDITML